MSQSERGVVFYLHVHQPWRVRKYDIFDTGQNHNYFSQSPDPDQDNELIFNKIANKSYRPMNSLLKRLLDKHPDFQFSLSITGTFIEQAERFEPTLLDSFRRLIDTGRVEILSETYHHSLAFFYDLPEFEAQVAQHYQKILDTFGVKTRVFRNTELAYNNDLARWAQQSGYRGVLAEGWDPVLGWRSPNYAYQPAGAENMGLLLKNYRLSDDIAFRFSDQRWPEWPLTAEKYTKWVDEALENAPLLNLFMDYETFGEHQWQDTGVFNFFEEFVDRWLDVPGNKFYTVSKALDTHPSQGEISVVDTTTWADSERDLTAWTGNNLQKEALRHLYAMKDGIYASADKQLISDWRRLQTADHVYYMSTKWSEDGNVHSYFSPYDSPYDAFLYYMNAIRDLRWRLGNSQVRREYHG